MTTVSAPSRHRLLIVLVLLLATTAAVVLTGVGAATSTPTDIDIETTNETVLYQGQNATLSVAETNETAVRLFGPEGQFVREYAVTDTVTILSTHLEGEGTYELRGLSANETSPGNGSDTITFEKRTHSLEAAFDHPVRTALEGDSSETRLVVDSDRASMPITLSAERAGGEELKGEELAALLDETDATVVDETTIALETQAVDFDAEGLEAGLYAVTVDVVDTTATETVFLTVTDDRQMLSFDERVSETPPSGVGTVTVDLGHAETAFLGIGNESAVNYEMVLEVTDVTGDGEVTIQIDTAVAGEVPKNESERCAGIDDPSSVAPPSTEGTISGPDADQIIVESPSTDEDDCVFDESRAFWALGDDEVAVHTVAAGDLERPLAAAEYELSLALTDEINRTEQDVGTLRIR